MIECGCGCTFDPLRQYAHFIACGDCTDAVVIDKVMGGQRDIGFYFSALLGR